MPVTEIARLNLLPTTSLQNPQLRDKLERARQAMENYTGRNFYYMRSHPRTPANDDAILYVVGEWDSVDRHLNDWVPSEENQALLRLLKADLSVEWLIHVDASRSTLPLPKTAGEVVGDGVFYCLDRYVVHGEKREGVFERALEMGKERYESYVRKVEGGSVGGGWIVEKTDDGEDTFVLLAPCKGGNADAPWQEEVENAGLGDDVKASLIFRDRLEKVDM